MSDKKKYVLLCRAIRRAISMSQNKVEKHFYHQQLVGLKNRKENR